MKDNIFISFCAVEEVGFQGTSQHFRRGILYMWRRK
jgi:hypothetical protein